MAKAKQPTDSPVIAFLLLAWENANRATEHSWERLNCAMRQALRVAIGAGFEFAAADFAALSTRFNSDRWLGDPERLYSMAVAEGNLSAAAAFEAWHGRPPLIADEVEPCSDHARFAHGVGRRARERLHVGCYFPWQGERVKLTSFSADGSAVACSYHPGTEDKRGYVVGHESKIRKRYCITREAIIGERAERKERAELYEKLSKLAAAGKAKAQSIMDLLGIEKREEFDRLPLAKIRQVLQMVLKKSRQG